MTRRNAPRPSLEELALPPGERARLRDLLYAHGVGNGTLLILPIDHGLEHGPIDFLPNPDAADPDVVFELALRGGFNAIACQIGVAERHWPRWAGRIPLILKLNGKTGIPPEDEAHSPLNASVEEAVRLGAHAVAYTLYVGSPAQSRHHEDLARVRRACRRYGMPLILWSYPRGTAVEAKGGRDSLYAVDYASRVALELGAHAVKLNMPRRSEADVRMPAPYRELNEGEEERLRRVVRSAGRTLVLFSGGGRVEEDVILERAKQAMEAGATGLVAGRNLWQRPMPEALKTARRIRKLFEAYGVPEEGSGA